MKDVVHVTQGKERKGFSSAMFGVMRMFYSFHKMDEHAEAFGFKSGKARMHPDDIPSTDDLNALIGAAKSLRDAAILILLADSGARIHEALALRLKDVDVLEARRKDGKIDRLVRVFFGKVKVEGEERRVLLEPETSAVLLKWIASYPKDIKGGGDRPLFPTNGADHYGEAVMPDTFRSALKSMARRAGFPKERVEALHPHSLRHAAATRLLRQGWTEAKVKARLGWTAGSAMLARYSHLVGRDVDTETLARNGYAVEEVSAERLIVPNDQLPAMPEVLNGEAMRNMARAAVYAELREIWRDLDASPEKEKLDRLKTRLRASVPQDEWEGIIKRTKSR
jgi:integrase